MITIVRCKSFVWVVSMIVLCIRQLSFASLAIMTDDELKAIDAQTSSLTLESFYEENDTIRLFMDIHAECYGTIESVRNGYYPRDSSQMQTNMASVGLSGFDGFYDVQDYNNGANYNFAKVTSDYNTLAPQGPATIKPWGNGGFSEKDPQGTLTPNTSYKDWDIWIDNLRFGESPDKPIYMNGLITRVEFDGDLKDNSPDKIQRIIIGTNDFQGNIYGNYHRYTGIANPMLLANTSARSCGSQDPYRYTPGSIQLIRDSFLQIAGINIFNVEDRDTGFWLIMNLKGDHISFEMVAGYPENALDFSYKEGLKDIPLWDPDWSPYLNGPLVDPYKTLTQDQSHNQE